MRLQCTKYCGRIQRKNITSYITQNPTDHFELIHSMEQLEFNSTEIYNEMHPKKRTTE